MSSKKAHRKRLQKQKARGKEEKERMNPATLFMLIIAAALLLLLAAGWLFGVGAQVLPLHSPLP